MAEDSGPEYIQAELSNFGVDMDISLAIKLHELGQTYQKSADDMVSEWFAYSTTLNDPTPTVEKILAMETKNFLKKLVSTPVTRASRASLRHESPIKMGNEEIDDVIEAFYDVGPSSSSRKAKTPVAIRSAIGPNETRRLVLFTPGSYSPGSCTPSEKYLTRKDSNTIVDSANFGAPIDLSVWKNSKRVETLNVEVWSDVWALTKKYPYMYDRLDAQRQALFTAAEELGKEIMESLKINEEIFPCVYVSNEDYYSVGRIFCDSKGQGKMNSASLCLENCSLDAPGSIVNLNVSQIEQNLENFALFPGQVVVVKGANPTGRTLIASELHPGLIPKPPETELKLQPSNSKLLILICSGPFTVNSNLLFEPWKDLIEEIKLLNPHVVFLFGPFIDSGNNAIHSATTEFSVIFDDLLNHLAAELKENDTKFVIVASSADVFHDNVYPTPPYSWKQEKNSDKIHFFSDPSLININGLVFGCSSTDILMQIGREECILSPGDRFTRLGGHLLKQRSFYPLYPPVTNVDFTHYEAHVDLPIRPHFLIIPSMFNPFVRKVSGTILINPGYLCKGNLGGTYALLEVDGEFRFNEDIASQGVSARVFKI